MADQKPVTPPVSPGASTAIYGASQVLGTLNSIVSLNAALAYEKKIAKLNQAEARRAAAAQYAALAKKTVATRSALMEAEVEAQEIRAEAVATATVNAATTGATGSSIDTVVNQLYAHEAEIVDRSRRQYEAGSQDINAISEDVRSSLTARLRESTVQGSSTGLIGAGLQLGTATLSTYNFANASEEDRKKKLNQLVLGE